MPEREFLGLKIRGRVSITPDVNEIVRKADVEGIDTVWHRFQYQQPQCGFGLTGVCCRHCNAGPCRIDPFGYSATVGTCGAPADLMAARELLDFVVKGMATRLQEAMQMLKIAEAVAKGETKDFVIKSPERLNEICAILGVGGKDDREKLLNLVNTIKREIERIDDKPLLTVTKLAPPDLVELWKQRGLLPRGVAREVFDSMYRANMGTDCEPLNIIKQALRVALCDGLLSTLTTTIIDEVLMGDKEPGKGRSGMGLIKPENVNIFLRVMPIYASKIVEASKDPELLRMAREVGAQGISVIIPSGNMIMQELPMLTGMIEVMVIDHQCVFPYLSEISKNFHTKIINVDPVAKLPGAIHMPMTHENASKVAREIVKIAIENYRNRVKDRVYVPSYTIDFVTNPTTLGFRKRLGGSLKVLADAIRFGDIKGILALHSCTNPKVKHNYGHYTIAKRLIENDVLVLAAGCSMTAMALTGLARIEALEIAGPGLRKVMKNLNLPPVITMGLCVETSRELLVLYEVARELGVPFNKAPFAASAPEWMNAKALSIALYFAAHGLPSHVGTVPPVLGAPEVERILSEELPKITGGKLIIEPDPEVAADLLIKEIEARRVA